MVIAFPPLSSPGLPPSLKLRRPSEFVARRSLGGDGTGRSSTPRRRENNCCPGVLDHPLSRVMTTECEEPSWHRKAQRLAAAAHIDRGKARDRKSARAAIALFVDLELALAGAELGGAAPV